MSISPLRQRFLAQFEQLPKQSFALSSKEALAEYQVELDRVDSLRAFDGKPGDLDPALGIIGYKNPGHSLSVPSEGFGWFHEADSENGQKPVLEYGKVESLFLAPPQVGPAINDFGQPAAPPRPTFETVTYGSNDPNTNTWVAKRMTEGPTGIRHEEIRINYADPAQSSKDVWILNA